MTAAVLLRARAVLRGHRRGAIAIAALLSLAGGVGMASVAGARRTDTAYERFIGDFRVPHALALDGTPGSDIPPADLDAISSLPSVEESWRGHAMFAFPTTLDGTPLGRSEYGLNALASDADYARAHMKIVEGRMPRGDRPDEVAFARVNRPHPAVRVGARVRLRVPHAGTEPFGLEAGQLTRDMLITPEPVVTIVGIVVWQGEVRGDARDIWATPAFARAYAARAWSLDMALVRLADGLDGVPAFTSAAQRISPGAFIPSAADERTLVLRTTRVQSVALFMFGALTLLAGLLLFAQGVSRQVMLDADEADALRSIGMTPGSVRLAELARALVIAGAGGVGAVGVGFALSPLFPFDVARVAEPSPGPEFNVIVLLFGAALLVGVALAFVAVPVWRAPRRREPRNPDPGRGSRVASGVARAGLGPAAVTGARLALERGRGRNAVPVRSAIAGIGIAIAAFVTASTFGIGFRHMLEDPAAVGSDWDLGGGNPFVADVRAQVEPLLRGDARVSEFSLGNISEIVPFGEGPALSVGTWAFEATQGSVHPAVVEGRWASRLDEVVLGKTTMRALRVGIGDEVRAGQGDRSATLRVVGRAVFPDFGFGPGLGEGAGMTLAGLRTLRPDVAANVFLIRATDRSAIGRIERDVNQTLEPHGLSISQPEGASSLTSLRAVSGLPFALASLLGIAALASLAHAVVAAVLRRRRELAILKSIGFTARDVRAAVAWQTTFMSASALLVAVPFGLVLGRWGWTLFAEAQGVVPDPRIHWAVVGASIPLTILAARAMGLIPARIAARTQPAAVLRSE